MTAVVSTLAPVPPVLLMYLMFSRALLIQPEGCLRAMSEGCPDTKYYEIIFHDACAVRIFALLDDVTHYCVTSAVEYYFRKWYDGFP